MNGTEQHPVSLESVPPAPSDAHMNKFLTVPNLLSILRMVLVIPFLLVMLSSIPSATVWGAVLIAIAALTDKLDGVLARKYHQTSEWGRILDPLADKLALAAGVLVLLVLKLVPLWFAGLVFGRDLLILLGGLYLKSTRGTVLPSNEAGKWTVGFITLTVFLLLVRVDSLVTDIAMSATSVMLLVSFVLYVSRFVEVIKNSGQSVHGTL